LKFDRKALRELLKSRGVKSLEDFNEFMSEVSKEVVETLLEGELTDHLGFEKYDHSAKTIDNSRNGFTPKTVKSRFGKVDLSVPRDRKSGFAPLIVKKGQRDISGMEDKIISLYAKGLTTRDIQSHVQELYNYSISPETVSTITDKVFDRAREWQSRPLSRIYSIIFMDAIFLKMRSEGHVKGIAVYNIIGINLDGHKECLGLWVGETESSKYWLSVLNELKNRGVEDVLIFSVDNLTGISEAIQSVYPRSEIQKCIVHQIRNSLKHVSWKDRKALTTDLKKIYKAKTEQEGFSALEDFENNWKKYPYVSSSWRRNWGELSTYFKFPKEIRSLIYTTNPIENVNRGIKKLCKNKAVFPNEQAVFKVVYLAIIGIEKKWTCRLRDWSLIYSQLAIFFGERLEKYL